jgi:ADP-ribose pyrophosphatase
MARPNVWRTVYRGPVFRVETAVLDEPGGVRERRDVVRHQGSIAVLPVHDDGAVTLVRQFRAPFGRRVLELAAGRIDPGETPLQAARRELREELGLRAARWERIVRILPTPGYCDETVVLFRASGVTAGDAEPEADERITAVRIPFARALRDVARGRIADAKTAVALLLEARRRDSAGGSGRP